jgi:NADPH:quinone reductase
MRAAVVHAIGRDPIVEDFPEPSRADDAAEVLAAALNPVDLMIVGGHMPFRNAPMPFVAGLEGVARLANGSTRYFFGPKMPYGSIAQRVPLVGADTAAVPQKLDTAVAAALGVSGLAAWLSLSGTGRLTRGESVLVLGADGQVGQVATTVARLLGASRVFGVVRTEEARRVALERGADAAVSAADLDTLSERLRAAIPEGVDLILDLLWGPIIGHALGVARHRGRVVQVGDSAGPTTTLSAAALRNNLVSILSHANFTFSSADRAAAYEQLAAHAAAGRLPVEVERIPLEDAASGWKRLKAGGSQHKLVVVP